MEEIRVNVSVRLDLEEVAKMLSPAQTGALMGGIANILNAGAANNRVEPDNAAPVMEG